MNTAKALRQFRNISSPRLVVSPRPSNTISRRCLHHQQPSPPSLLRSSTLHPSTVRLQSSSNRHILSQRQTRHESSSTAAPRPLTDRPEHAPKPDTPREEVPSYEMTFTCRVCKERSSHRITKQGYHHGTILISCPGCKNRHLISDHMKIFSDTSLTIEDILKEKGQLLKKGSLGAEGDVEFWDDGSQTERKKKPDSDEKPKL